MERARNDVMVEKLKANEWGKKQEQEINSVR